MKITVSEAHRILAYAEYAKKHFKNRAAFIRMMRVKGLTEREASALHMAIESLYDFPKKVLDARIEISVQQEVPARTNWSFRNPPSPSQT